MAGQGRLMPGAVFVAMSMAYTSLLAWAAGSFAALLKRNPAIARWQGKVAGGIFIALGGAARLPGAPLPPGARPAGRPAILALTSPAVPAIADVCHASPAGESGWS